MKPEVLLSNRKCVSHLNLTQYAKFQIRTLFFKNLLVTLNTAGQVEPLVNFYDFEAIRMPAVGGYDTTTEGKWKFKFEWQLENQVLGELIWEQSFPPGRGSLF